MRCFVRPVSSVYCLFSARSRFMAPLLVFLCLPVCPSHSGRLRHKNTQSATLLCSLWHHHGALVNHLVCCCFRAIIRLENLLLLLSFSSSICQSLLSSIHPSYLPSSRRAYLSSLANQHPPPPPSTLLFICARLYGGRHGLVMIFLLRGRFLSNPPSSSRLLWAAGSPAAQAFLSRMVNKQAITTPDDHLHNKDATFFQRAVHESSRRGGLDLELLTKKKKKKAVMWSIPTATNKDSNVWTDFPIIAVQDAASFPLIFPY